MKNIHDIREAIGVIRDLSDHGYGHAAQEQAANLWKGLKTVSGLPETTVQEALALISQQEIDLLTGKVRPGAEQPKPVYTPPVYPKTELTPAQRDAMTRGFRVKLNCI